MDDCIEIGGCCRAALEYVRSDEGLSSEVLLVNDEPDQANAAQNKGNESSPARPWIHHATPGYWNQEAGSRSEKENGANPVNSAQLLQEGARLVV